MALRAASRPARSRCSASRPSWVWGWGWPSTVLERPDDVEAIELDDDLEQARRDDQSEPGEDDDDGTCGRRRRHDRDHRWGTVLRAGSPETRRPAAYLGAMGTRYLLRTFGCQMNEHDSGIQRPPAHHRRLRPDRGRDRGERRRVQHVRDQGERGQPYGNLGHLRPLKERNLADADGAALPRAEGRGHRSRSVRRGSIAVVGTHALPGLLDLLRRAEAEGPQLDAEYTEVFPSALPARREVPHHAWVSIAVGCDNACTFCIVPLVRGPQLSRPDRRRPRRGAGRGPAWSR